MLRSNAIDGITISSGLCIFRFEQSRATLAPNCTVQESNEWPDPIRSLTVSNARGNIYIYKEFFFILLNISNIEQALSVYGPALKEVIHEEFGDGVVSAIDFTVKVEREPNPAGDRVRLTWSGKFLPYKNF